VRVAFLVAPVAYGIFNVAVCGAGMSARIDKPACAVTEPHVALTGGEMVARALRRAEMRGGSYYLLVN